MPTEQSVQIDSLLAKAMAQPPEERGAYLQQVCGADLQLRAELETLLKLHAQAGSFLEQPAVAAFETAQSVQSDVPPGPCNRSAESIGQYKLLERIGEGGFGTVYMAEQHEPVLRRVALKVIKPGMDSKQVIARFEAERQALAMMDHPNIARVLDASEHRLETGATMPYFVMELVRGEPITKFCDDNKLTIRQRLELAIDVCHAVQHAHMKGVIHRDLKPSNVLVTMHDDKAVPKVIDFGIAKATQGRLTEKTLYTEFRQLIGTPAYMSPEQAQMTGIDIDTRSDIYSLGVMLYELLTGTTPFDVKTLLDSGYDEMRRIIREVEPPNPSTRLSSLLAGAARARSSDDTKAAAEDAESPARGTRSDSSSAEAIADRRLTDVTSLRRTLRGDLDWIVMKCLEKDRGRRYETANGLAMDIARHLRHEPVLAGPPSGAYRFRKFVRRNRGIVTAGALISIALLTGMAGTTFGLLRAEQRRAEAEDARRLAEKREKQTEQVSGFQAAMLHDIDIEAMGRGIRDAFRDQVRAALERQYVGDGADRRKRTLAEIEAELAAFDQRADAAQAVDVARRVMDKFVLARAADTLEEEFANEPLVQAELLSAIGCACERIGLFTDAELQLRNALENYRRILGGDHSATLAAMENLGVVLAAQGKPTEAEPYYREALEKRRRTLGDEHPVTLRLVSRMGGLANSLGKPREAEPYHREVLEARRRALGDLHPDTLGAIDTMAATLSAMGRYAEAEPYFLEALEGCRCVLGDKHPDTLTCLDNLGAMLKRQRRLDEALPYVHEALEGRRRVLGNEHPHTLNSINNMGDLLHYQGKLADAEPYYREALLGYRRVLGDEHPETLGAINNLGFLYRDQGKLAEAQSVFAEGLQAARARSDNSSVTAMIEHHYADVLLQVGRLDEALNLAQSAADQYRANPDWSPEARHALRVLGAALRAAGRDADAITVQRELVERTRQRYGGQDPQVAEDMADLANIVAGREGYAAAEPMFTEALEIFRKAYGDQHELIARTLNNMAVALWSTDPAATERLLRETIAIRRTLRGADPELSLTLNDLAWLLEERRDYAAAEQVYREALAMQRELLGNESSHVEHTLFNLTRLKMKTGDNAAADQLLREFLAVSRSVFGPEHSRMRAVELLRQSGRLVDVEPLLREQLELSRQKLPQGHPAVANDLAQLINVLLELGRYSEARPLARECLEIRQTAINADSPQYWLLPNTRSMLGGALAGQGAALIESNANGAIAMFTEAEPLLVESAGWLSRNADRIPQEYRPLRLRQALERLVTLYESWDALAPNSGKAEQAAEWRIELEKLAGP